MAGDRTPAVAGPGKLDQAQAVVHGYAGYLQQLRARELPITSLHALTAGLLTWEHRDPFDRVIATQCMLESIPLVTADKGHRQLPRRPARRVVT